MLSVLSRQRPNLVHFPDQSMPLLPLPCPSVVTIHDLAPRIMPETYARSRFLYKYLMSWIAVHRSTKIIADSESTKRDILRTFRVSPSKIAVITFGPKKVFRPISSQVQLEQTRRRLGLPQCFILYVGGIDARKNLVRLVEAFDLLRNTQHASVHLLIAGPNYYMHERVYQRVEELDLADRVHFLGFVAEGDLVHLYNLARVFVLPSLHEGLGFPILEAMACGVPVVASNLSSLPEVVGDAGILVNPLDTYGLAAAIQKLLVDDVLREELIKKGLDRTKSFAWDGIVEKLNSVYNEAVNS
jgi:glycosyltransferase involved in cell wall biosynthesis